MSRLIFLIATLFLLAFPILAQAQGELPIPVREAAIADLNSRLPFAGRPASWSYRLATSDNENLECPTVAQGRAITPIIQVYIIDLIYSGASYTYYVSADAQWIVPCDTEIPNEIARTPVPLAMPSVPSAGAEYGYVSATCPPDMRGWNPVRLAIGGFGMTIAAGDPAFLYAETDTSSALLKTLPQLASLYILAGPECREGQVWWKVEWDGLIGWTAESRIGGYYFIEPLSPRDIQVTIPPTPSATPSPTLTFTPTATFTPTPTPTLTFTPTATFTPTLTPTFTLTPTVTASHTPEPIFPETRGTISPDNAADLTQLGALEANNLTAASWGTLGTNAFYAVVGDQLDSFSAFNLVSLGGPPDTGEGIVTTVNAHNRHLLIGKSDGSLRLLEFNDSFSRRDLPAGVSPVTRILFSGTGLFASVESGDSGHVLRVWTLDPLEWNTPDGLRLVIPHTSAFTAAFSPDGSHIATHDGTQVYVVEIASGEAESYPISSGAGCLGLAWTAPDSILYADCTRIVQLNLADGTGQPFAQLANVQEITPNPAKDVLALRTSDSVVMIDAASGEELHTIAGVASQALFEPSGTLLGIVSPSEGVRFFGIR